MTILLQIYDTCLILQDDRAFMIRFLQTSMEQKELCYEQGKRIETFPIVDSQMRNDGGRKKAKLPVRSIRSPVRTTKNLIRTICLCSARVPTET